MTAADKNSAYFKAPVFAVAPMIDWTKKPGNPGLFFIS